ncbi:hypothetical protein G7Y89_g15796 [Cudoniella acicularis]|uniref:Uncharacterized protein n=1 Tax=Cudoniella acicularis TaxID=354080 RepID=A0A8H4QF23_9HELO|nr:hypothetical protein G7Y89_g15796 [Cudoniella acicularis]
MADRAAHARSGDPHFHSRSRSRSRSPRRHHTHSHRSRSPHKRKRTFSHSHSRELPSIPKSKSTAPPPPTKAKELPYNARQLNKHDYNSFKQVFALYLDIQKGGLVLDDLDEKERRGRWKSFLGKWNRGELAEGWYDPSTLRKAVDSTDPDADMLEAESKSASKSEPEPTESKEDKREEDGDSESDDDIGPTLPGQEGKLRGRMGPSIPNMQDLELKREMELEDNLSRRDDIRQARKLDRLSQKARLDELVPRAEAGTRERQLEKKKELADKLKSFRDKSPGAVAEVPEEELMGGGDGIGEFKKVKQEFERKKNERELRKEEILRARVAEREERLREYRGKEEKTMEMLRGLARSRFG